ncbi:phage tail tape measure protein [Pseudomonas sp. S75]|uniref:phage tail tape measure protein n=1 Tax=unclassified Pseudomonas TaxID=196821 RepID=UPI001906C16E|nr:MULTISPECIES: phage tail tape measure protein [unclassified Pseudomonas]MBJ9978419.1 phage tail tape measure protein [Pseudomonas sp. S30]MBK0156374.1 phage tail tape measure protein [Pseudomonas sp. S75]
MTSIAELGIRIDSGDATQAATDLDKLTDAGKRSEESAGRTGRAWESALAGMQGDTRQIVVELQQLNQKQAQLAQQMITVGHAVTTASTAFSGAAANMTAMRAGAEKAGQAQTVLSTANEAAAQTGRAAAESAEQQQARLLGMAKASLEASEYVQTLNRATQQTVEITRQANTVLSDRASQQAAVASRAQTILANEDRLAAASKATAAAQRDEGKALGELLGKIDPTVAALGRLDDMERRLQGYRSSGALDAETFTEYQTKLNQARTALGGVDAALGKTGMSAKQTAAAMRMLPAQFSDVVISLQAGQSPLTVLLQQGAQVKDSFGGVGAAARAMGGYVAGLVTPVSAAAAAVGVLGFAAYQAGREQDTFNQAIILTGNYAGTSGAKLTDLARQISSTVGTTGAAASVLAQMAGAGDLAGESFKIVATTALEMERATGRAVEETLADFRKITDDPVKAAEDLNKRYHWLTASTLEQVRALVEQGDKTEAVKLITEQFGETMTRRAQIIREEMSGLPKLFDDIGEAASRMWDGVKGVWRDPTLDDTAERLRLQIRSMENIQEDFRNDGNYDPKKLKSWRAKLAEIEGLSKPAGGVVSIQGQGDNDKLNAMLDRAAPKAEKLADRMKEIDRLVASNRKQGFTVTDEQVEQLRARARKDFKETKTPTTPVNLTDVKDSRNALSMILSDYRGYEKELNAIQKSGVISQEAVYAQRLALAKQQRADVTSAYMEEIQALEEAKGRASTTGEQRIQLDQRIAKARSDMVRAQREADSDLAVLATAEIGRQEKQTAASEAFVNQLERERQALATRGDRAAASIGLGDRQAGLQRELDDVTDNFNRKRETLLDRRRTAPDKYTEQDHLRDLAELEAAENKYRDTVLTNYDKMTAAQSDWRNGVSSGFENYLDNARNFAAQAQTVVSGAFEGMEDAVVTFVKTGKLSFKDFADQVVSDLIRIQVRQAAAGFLGSALGFLGGGSQALGQGTMTGFSESIPPGTFSSGGYTGDGGKYQPMGVVHGGEFVLRKEVVAQPGMRHYLDRLNQNGYADGGFVTPLKPPVASSKPMQSSVSVDGLPPIINQIEIHGNPDEAQLARTEESVTRASNRAYQMMLSDLKKNGPAMQLIRRNR